MTNMLKLKYLGDTDCCNKNTPLYLLIRKRREVMQYHYDEIILILIPFVKAFLQIQEIQKIQDCKHHSENGAIVVILINTFPDPWLNFGFLFETSCILVSSCRLFFISCISLLCWKHAFFHLGMICNRGKGISSSMALRTGHSRRNVSVLEWVYLPCSSRSHLQSETARVNTFCPRHITKTSYWARWCLKSPESPLFTQPFVQA